MALLYLLHSNGFGLTGKVSLFASWNYNTDLHIGFYPSFIQSLALGSGFRQKVPL